MQFIETRDHLSLSDTCSHTLWLSLKHIHDYSCKVSLCNALNILYSNTTVSVGKMTLEEQIMDLCYFGNDIIQFPYHYIVIRAQQCSVISWDFHLECSRTLSVQDTWKCGNPNLCQAQEHIDASYLKCQVILWGQFNFPNILGLQE